MSEDVDIHDQIEAYLKGKLKGGDLELFNKKLNDPEFREKVELQKVANAIVITKQLSLLKDQMKADLADNSSHGFFRRFWPTLLLIPIAVIIFTLNKEKETNVSRNSSNNNTTAFQKVTPRFIEKDNHLPSIASKKFYQEKPSNETNVQSKLDSLIRPLNLKDGENKPSTDNSNNQNFVTPPVIVKDSVKSTITKENNACNLKLSNDLFSATAACEDKADGSIIIDPEKDIEGKAPFRFSISNRGYAQGGIFKNLAAGLYTITVKDARQCAAELTIEVSAKKCKEIINDAFNPNVSTWKFPLGEYEAGDIKIYNKSGRLVYSKDISEKEEWNGRDIHGQELEEGLYAFVIVFKDGTEQNGYISIMY